MHSDMTYLLIIGAAVVALAALAALVNYVISIVRSIQQMRHAENPPRNPPLPEELAKEYATKRELTGEVADLKQEIKEERMRVDCILKQQFDLIRSLTADTTTRFCQMERSINEWQRGIERLIGKIEGKVENK